MLKNITYLLLPSLIGKPGSASGDKWPIVRSTSKQLVALGPRALPPLPLNKIKGGRGAVFSTGTEAVADGSLALL